MAYLLAVRGANVISLKWKGFANNCSTRCLLLDMIVSLHICLKCKLQIVFLEKSISRVLINTYHSDTELFIDGESIWCSEETIQGDPLAMTMYPTGIITLIHWLDDLVEQMCHTDDAAGGGTLTQLHKWWDLLMETTPQYCYYANTTKQVFRSYFRWKIICWSLCQRYGGEMDSQNWYSI